MTIDFALLIVRIVVGLLFFGHGAQKLFGWFGGGGLNATTGWLGSIGLHPARFWALLAGLTEFGGGILLGLGLLNPLGPLGIVAAMVFAIANVHWTKGIWSSGGGYEYPLTLIATSTVVALVGVGAYSLDAVLNIALPASLVFFVGVIAILIVTASGLAMTHHPGASAQKSAA